MNARITRLFLLAAGAIFVGCAGFMADYQNVFNRNYAFTASSYTGMSNVASEGVESYHLQDTNLPEYSAVRPIETARRSNARCPAPVPSWFHNVG